MPITRGAVLSTLLGVVTTPVVVRAQRPLGLTISPALLGRADEVLQ